MGAFERSTKNEDGQYEYAYLAGFYMQQLLTLAADSQESTDTLIRDLQRAVVFKQQFAYIATTTLLCHLVPTTSDISVQCRLH
jgi:hypothetical protein